MAKPSASQTLATFVRRARRIEANSIAADHEYLRSLARGEVMITATDDSELQIVRHLPEEEAFESLAARLRPLLLHSESIFHAKICDAIVEQVTTEAGENGLAHHTKAELDRLRQDWADAALSKTAEPGYVVQQTSSLGGLETTTPQLSASLIADGWLYLDLVHVDPHGEKAHAGLLPLRERYAAAVHCLARLALMAIATLELLRAARGKWLDVPDEVWDTEVTVAQRSIVETVSLLLASPVVVGWGSTAGGVTPVETGLVPSLGLVRCWSSAPVLDGVLA